MEYPEKQPKECIINDSINSNTFRTLKFLDINVFVVTLQRILQISLIYISGIKSQAAKW